MALLMDSWKMASWKSCSVAEIADRLRDEQGIDVRLKWVEMVCLLSQNESVG